MDFSNYKRLSTNVQICLKEAEGYVKDKRQTVITEEHILYRFLSKPQTIACKILNRFGIREDNFKEMMRDELNKPSQSNSEIDCSPELKRDFALAENAARHYASDSRYFIGSEHLLFAIFYTKDTNNQKRICSQVSRYFDVEAEKISALALLAIKKGFGVLKEAETKEAFPKEEEQKSEVEEIFSEQKGGSRLPDSLLRYGVDLTERANGNELDPVIGRSAEIEKVIQILSRRSKNNPVLIGEPGVGKSAVVEGLAQAIVSGDVPNILLDKIVYALDLSLVVSGTKFRGEFEERLNTIIGAIKRSGNIILFIDEIHNLVGAGGSSDGAMDASNIVKPLLARGELQTVGATTIEEYRKYIEKDAALERRFTPVMVEQPTVEQTIEILKGLRDKYEAHHSVRIGLDAIEAAAKLSDRYITDRFLPDKAIDLIDEAAAKARLAAFKAPKRIHELKAEIERLKAESERYAYMDNIPLSEELGNKIIVCRRELDRLKAVWDDDFLTKQPKIGKEDVERIVSEWAKIPLTKLSEQESVKLLKLEDALHKRIIGQDEAIHAVSNCIRRSSAGLSDGKRPVGSFIFVGPTGVGKTDLTKALAEELFGDEKQIIRLDMSEYMEKDSVAKIIGAPPGYVGYGESESGLLTEKVRRKPYSVVLFDEIEKAHPDVFNLFLQILDDGRLTDSKGRTVSFKNCIVVMTSNVGASSVREFSALGFSESNSAQARRDDYEKMKDNIMEELKKSFRPEFLNRFDDIIVFHRLTKEQAMKICDNFLSALTARMRERGMDLVVPPVVKQKLVEEGYSEVNGARPLRRVIQRRIEDALSEEILAGNIGAGERAVACLYNDRIDFRKENI